MIYRIFGAAFLILFGISTLGLVAVPSVLIGGAALIAGIALAVGI